MKKLRLDFRTIKEMYEGGQSIPKIAELFDCSTASIYRLFSSHQYSFRHRPRLPNGQNKKEIVSKDGYIKEHKPSHHRANKMGYVYQHILVMEDFIGRPITNEEAVHHINHNKHDNRLENLELLSNSEHLALHRSKPIKCLSSNEKYQNIKEASIALGLDYKYLCYCIAKSKPYKGYLFEVIE